MLIALQTVLRSSIQGPDGYIGTVDDLYFDTEAWNVRYLVVAAGSWLEDRHVLLSPTAIERSDWKERTLVARYNQQKIAESPTIDPQQQVTRQQEVQLAMHFGWPTYWDPNFGGTAVPAGFAGRPEISGSSASEPPEELSDPRVRSVSGLTGYTIQATDGGIGHLEDLIVDDQAWVLRYLVADTGNWLPGRQMLLPLDWVEQIGWHDGTLHLNSTREQIEASPDYDPSAPVNREYEEHLYDYYGREKYWE